MATKKQPKGKKTEQPKDLSQSKPDVKLAEEGHLLASLLWQKVLANLSPELQEALLVHKHLAYIWDQVAPDDFHRVPHPNITHGELIDNMHKAEYLLTGQKWGLDIGLPDGYEFGEGLKQDYPKEN